MQRAPTAQGWTGITIHRLVGGRVVEEGGEEAAVGLIRQLGVMHDPFWCLMQTSPDRRQAMHYATRHKPTGLRREIERGSSI